jgi:hypothetical protein
VLERQVAPVAKHPSQSAGKRQHGERPAVANRGGPIIDQTLQPSPADLLVGRIKALTFTGRQQLGPFALNLLVRCLIAFGLLWIEAIFFEPGIRSIESHADLSALLTTIIVCGGGLILLFWLREKIKPGRILCVVGSLFAALFAVYLSAVCAGILVGAIGSPAPFILQWFFLITIISFPLILKAKTTVCNIHNGLLG